MRAAGGVNGGEREIHGKFLDRYVVSGPPPTGLDHSKVVDKMKELERKDREAAVESRRKMEERLWLHKVDQDRAKRLASLSTQPTRRISSAHWAPPPAVAINGAIHGQFPGNRPVTNHGSPVV
jgi:hypothetical protein